MQLEIRYRFWRNCFLIQGLVVITGIIIIVHSWLHVQKQQQVKIFVLSQQQEQLHSQRYFLLLQQLSLLIPDSCWITAIKEQQNGILILAAQGSDHAAIVTFFHKLSEKKELGNIYLNKIEQGSDAKYQFIIHVEWHIEEEHHE